MNDFTKEELIMLKRLTLQNVNQFRENSDCGELKDKIQSMIDNYCEHLWMDGSGHLVFCVKCNAYGGKR